MFDKLSEIDLFLLAVALSGGREKIKENNNSLVFEEESIDNNEDTISIKI